MIKERFGELQQLVTPMTGKQVGKKKSQRFGKLFSITAATALLCTNVLMIEKSQALEDEVPLMDKVVVTATRQEEKISSIPANVTVISEQEIANSPAATVPELLRITPGVVVSDTTGNGRNITVDLRGFGERAASNTLLLIDGRRVNLADQSDVDWTLIPKDRIQRIEIVHGGRGSVLYGDNASGGVINIITKRGEGNKIVAGAAIGSYQSLISNAGVSGSTEKISYAVNGNFRTSEGYRDNSDTNAKDVGLNLEYFASDRFNINLSGGYHKDDTSIPGALQESALASGTPRKSSTSPQDFNNIEDYYIQASPKLFFTDTSYVTLDASSRQTDKDVFSSSVWGTYSSHTEIDTLTASPQVVLNENFFGFDSKLIMGFDYNHSKEMILNDSSSFPPAKSFQLTKDDYGYYAHAEIPINEALSVSGGLRNDRAKYKFRSTDTGVDEDLNLDENLYNVGLTYGLSDNASAYFGYSKSFRYPLLDEIFNFFSNTVTTTFRPQTTDDFEIGARVQFESGLNLSANLFRLDTEHELFYNPAGGPFGFGANENMDGDVIRQGVEIKASQQFLKILLKGSYTFKDAKIDGGQYDGKDFPNVPVNQFTVGAETKICKQVRLNLDGSYIGERPFISDFANTNDDNESYFYLTGKLTYLFDKGSAYLTVNNLLNEKYSEIGTIYVEGDPTIYPSPEINFLAGLNLNF